jgi:hypothetical protein
VDAYDRDSVVEGGFDVEISFHGISVECSV